MEHHFDTGGVLEISKFECLTYRSWPVFEKQFEISACIIIYEGVKNTRYMINRSAITHCRNIFKLERQASKTSEEYKNVVN